MFGQEEQQRMDGLIKQLIRIGTVTTIDPVSASARVRFQDRNDMVSYNLPVLVRNSLQNKDYWMPDINEQVLCLFLPVGVEQGWILGSFYSKVTTPPASSQDKRRTVFEDGTSVEYDRESHTLTIDVPADGGNVVVNAQTKVTVNSPLIDLGEDGSLEPSVLGNKLAAWMTAQLKPWLDSHNHISASSGNPTSPASGGPAGAFDVGNGAAGGNIYSTKNRNQ